MTEEFQIIKGMFSLDEQRDIYKKIQAIQPSFFTPKTRWGTMNLQMNCLGWHWNAITYKYEQYRSDFDMEEVAPFPSWLQDIANQVLKSYWDGPRKDYDICICNWYDEDKGKLGVHQDDSERIESLEAGYPVLSISIGSDCVFTIGGLTRKGEYTDHVIQSGDVILFGGSRRLAFHGVKKLIKNTTPEALGIPAGRLNLTLRVY